VAAAGSPASVLREEVLARYFGPGVQVLRTADGDIAVISGRHGHLGR